VSLPPEIASPVVLTAPYVAPPAPPVPPCVVVEVVVVVGFAFCVADTFPLVFVPPSALARAVCDVVSETLPPSPPVAD
jgi:hypothetical protein